MAKKLKSLKLLMPFDMEKEDSVKMSRLSGARKTSFDILMRAQNCWVNMEKFRRARKRCLDYMYGNQWGDIVHVDGRDMTEEEYIMRQGSVPLKTNLIRKLVNTTKGVYISQDKEPVCTARDRAEQQLGEMMTTALQYVWDVNEMKSLYADGFEDFCAGGLIVARKSYGRRNGKMDVWTDLVQPDYFFIDSDMRDPRGWDCNIVGEIHDVTIGDLISSFAKTQADADRIKNIYQYASNSENIEQSAHRFGYTRYSDISFLNSTNPSRCRVIEVWTKERKPRINCHDPLKGELFKIDAEDYQRMVIDENSNRVRQGTEQGMQEDEIPLIKAEWFVDTYWYYRFIAPTGEILDEGETPYEHDSHPYVFRMSPFVNAEIHSFVSDVIDPQRYANRLITLYDFVIRAQAKGVLMVPKQIMEDSGMTPEEFADEWARFNGIIFYTAKGDLKPQQIVSNSRPVGVSELLQMQIGFFDEITGVNGALQGKPGSSGTSGSYYAQQTQNATTSLLGILQSFSAFIKASSIKDVKLIQQFYDTKRVYNITGARTIVFDPEKIRNVEFDLRITESQSTPVFRQMANDFLMKIFDSGQISLEMLLKHGDFPFSDALLQDVRSQNEQLAKMQQGDTSASDQLRTSAADANPESVNMLRQAMFNNNQNQAS